MLNILILMIFYFVKPEIKKGLPFLASLFCFYIFQTIWTIQ